MHEHYLEEGNSMNYVAKMKEILGSGVVEQVEHYKFVKYQGVKKEDGLGVIHEKGGNVFVWKKLK